MDFDEIMRSLGAEVGLGAEIEVGFMDIAKLMSGLKRNMINEGFDEEESYDFAKEFVLTMLSSIQ